MADETKPKAPKKEKAEKAEGAAAAPAAEKAGGEGKPAGEGKPVGEGKPKKEKAPKAAAGAAAEGGAAPAAAAPEGPVAAAAPTAQELLGDDPNAKKIVKAKGSKNISTGIATISATFNNTQVAITDMQGNVIGWSSAGRVGFKGSRKSTAFAAQQVAQDAARQAMSHGMREIEVRVKGPGSGRESAIRALQAIGL